MGLGFEVSGLMSRSSSTFGGVKEHKVCWHIRKAGCRVYGVGFGGTFEGVKELKVSWHIIGFGRV